MGHDRAPDDDPIADRYRLDRILGAGAAAVVYEGRDLVADRPVAIKVYRQGGSLQPRLQQNREIAALAMLRHEGLVTLYDGGTETGPDGRTYLVTDLVVGPTLAERLRDGPLDTHAVRDLAAGLASALAHVHSRGFIHRDIKPANILLDSGHRPRLADFGIARAFDGTVATATGAVAGTAAYLAPEQVRGSTVEAAVDVYALGLVLLEALTGQREYPGTAVESATARLHRRPVVPAGLPWNLTTLLESMTETDPTERPTAEAVVTALAHATDAIPTPVVVEPAAPRPRPLRRRQRRELPALVAAALLLAFLLGGASLLIFDGGPTNSPPSVSTGPAAEEPWEPAATGAVPVTPAPAVAPVAAVAGPAPARVPANAAALAVYARIGPVPGTSDTPAAPARDAGPGSATDETPAAAPADGNGNGKGKNKVKANGNANGNGKGKGNGGA